MVNNTCGSHIVKFIHISSDLCDICTQDYSSRNILDSYWIFISMIAIFTLSLYKSFYISFSWTLEIAACFYYITLRLTGLKVSACV